MALINHAKREINAKIVYFGREGTGKRESLQYIYDRIKSTLRGGLKAPTTGGDSLFFFDFSPFENKVFGDYRLRFHVYTLTGRVANPAAWKMILKGADGLMIVADASPLASASSRQSVLELRDFLAAYGVGLSDIPSVLQIVKGSESGGLSAEVAAAEMGLPGFQACVTEPQRGTGVLDALSRLSRQILTRIGQDAALHGDMSSDSHEPLQPDAPAIETIVPPKSYAQESAAIVNKSICTELPEGMPVDDGACRIKVDVVGSGAESRDGMMKIPLEISVAGTTRRLLVSIAIDEV
jgi:hypothetical protein